MNGKMRKYIAYIIATHMFAALFCFTALADGEAVFRIDMDSLNLQTGMSGNIVVSMTNAQGAKIAGIEGIENFDILSQSQSSVTSIAGGVSEYRDELYYTVMPKAAGQFSLKAYIEYDGQIFETNSLQLNVGENAGNQDEEAAQDLFIKTIISHEEAYIGEKIVLAYELYSRYSIDSYGFTADFAMDGIVARQIPDNQLKSEHVYIAGERYAVYEVKKLVIDPIRTGEYVIAPCNFQVNVITNRSGGFGGFFRSTTPMYLQTEQKELNVKPLPSDGKPADFSGIVGNLQLESRYSRDELDYGDSLALYFSLSGICNLDPLKNNVIGEIAGFSVYETQKNAAESVEGNLYHVKKDFEAILVPERNGVLEISPIFVTYFDPVSEKYEKAEIPGTAVTVLGDMPQPNSGGIIQSSAGEALVINQVKYEEENSRYFAFRIKKEAAYIALAASAATIALFAVLAKSLAKKKKRDPKLKSIYGKLAGAKDIHETYGLLNSMLKHRYGFSIKASSKNNVKDSLPDEDLASKALEVMDYMESAGANERSSQKYLKDKIRGIYRSICKNEAQATYGAREN